MLHQSAVIATAKQAIEHIPGAVTAAIIHKNQRQNIVTLKKLGNALQGVCEIGKCGPFIEAGHNNCDRNPGAAATGELLCGSLYHNGTFSRVRRRYRGGATITAKITRNGPELIFAEVFRLTPAPVD